ncbi:RagB/SusD family nutrient uptake outer membrane protein [uncultured Parabacteroides sp.]|uniref:RagB/SusD family nutrient uptake outer membrane protein n=2 Tax=uncultured Parabacteroides sp. TaxID=512312 RepID=UPI0026593A03|nr:RagB/SusD family nutrient uptake outer membrane protein [uncultured Parabacteroides sp.]
MKKNFIYIALLAITLFGFSSCSDFLDRIPDDELSDGSFWKTPNDAKMFIADVYRQVLPGGDTGDIDGDIESDNAVHGIKWAAGDVSKGIYDPAAMSWSGDYKAIRACNILLSKIDNIPDYDQTDKEAVMAEARFLRGYIYFGLIQTFGGVPYVDQPVDLKEMGNITRTPVEEVYAKVMEDFDYAIAHLPAEWGSSDYGRATKGAANAMKARAALYFKHYDTAVDAAKAVMDSGKYELFDANNTGKYAHLFWEEQEACKEAILVRQFNAPELTNYIIGWGCFPTKGWGGINPTQSLVDAFECIDGSPIDKSTTYDPTNPFKDRDPRLEVCVLHDGEEMYGVTIKTAPLKSSSSTGVAQHNDATATGYYDQKWLDPSIDPQSTGWDMGKDWHVIRYAEVLLTYAEAKNEITALDASAFEAVNQIRRRVGMPDLQNTDATKPTYCGTQDALRQRIRNEWRVEFAMEGSKRKWDIRRWGIAKDVLNAPFLGMKYKMVDDPNAPEGDNGKKCILYQGENIKLTGSKYEDHNYLFPIPQEEIDLNPALTQNPGYPTK